MKTSIVTIGDELLNGSITDTNSTFMAKHATKIGLEITSISSISDKLDSIVDTLKSLSNQSQFIFLSGGLGPTKDDITLDALSKLTNDQLVFNNDIYLKVLKRLERRSISNVTVDKDGYKFPKNAVLLNNKKGTAPGIWLKYKNSIIVSMPGVPLEMKQIFVDEVIPKIQSEFCHSSIINRYIKVAQIWESKIAEKIDHIEKALPENLTIAYLPKLGEVTLRITGINSNENTIEKVIQEISKELEDYVYSYNETDSLADCVGKMLLDGNSTLSTAESCTGGKIAHKITSVAGSSRYFEGSVISYSTQIKIDTLKVRESTIDAHGAVSEQTVKEMAINVRKLLKTDYSIAVSGIAGPDGGSDLKPVGTVWIAIANSKKVLTKRFQFWPFREENIELSSIAALFLLKQFISENF